MLLFVGIVIADFAVLWSLAEFARLRRDRITDEAVLPDDSDRGLKAIDPEAYERVVLFLLALAATSDLFLLHAFWVR